jgi:8-oxo-dGTP diphosphatase
MTIVVAAVIEQENRVLICRRRADQAHPLKWEFAGGKVEPNETPVAALARELEEELGILAEIGPQIADYEYAYSARPPIRLIFYGVTKFAGEVENRVFEEIRWETRERLPGYDFLEGDLGFVRMLAGNSSAESAI